MKTKREKQRALGIDFGGTSIKLGYVNEQGKIEAQTRIATKGIASVAVWLDAIEKGIERLNKGKSGIPADVVGIGVGVPGFVDHERGYIYDLPNVKGWQKIALAQELEARFGLRSYIDNDVNAMAVGEFTFGSGRLYYNAVFITLGTGVGGALVINKKLFRGSYSMAGEIGHMVIDMKGRRSPQGRGGLEQYVGNRKIIDHTVKLLKRGRSSMITKLVDGDYEAVTPKVIAQAAHKGDELGLEVFDYVADCLASAFASVTYLLQPQVFIIGGGVADSGSVLFDPLKQHLNNRLSPVFSDKVEIRKAELGNNAGIIGSATLAHLG